VRRLRRPSPARREAAHQLGGGPSGPRGCRLCSVQIVPIRCPESVQGGVYPGKGRKGRNRDNVVGKGGGGTATLRIREIDWQDLLVGVFVSGVIVVGPGLGDTIRSLAEGIIVVQLLFELPMALLAVAAGQAARVAGRVARITLLSLGAFAVILSGVGYALEFGLLLVALPGVFAVISRTRRSRADQIRFGIEHCSAVERVAGVSWGWLVLLILGTSLFAGISSQPISLTVTDGAINWFGAVFWLVYYAGLSIAVPAARQGRVPWREGRDMKRRPASAARRPDGRTRPR
jgi:hypothetical protein